MIPAREKQRRWMLVFVVFALIAAACSGGPPEASGPSEAGLIGGSDVTRTEEDNVDRSGPFTVSVFHEQSNGTVDINLVAPTSAAEVQVAFEPTFSNSPWQAVSDISMMTLSTGIQEFFVRYRDSDGDAVGGTDTLAFSILAPLVPITGSEANPDNVRVTRVATDVLQVDLIVGEVVFEATGQAWLPGPDLPIDRWVPGQTTVTLDGEEVDVAEISRQTWPVGNIDGDTFALRHRLHVRLAQPISGSTAEVDLAGFTACLLYTSPSPRDQRGPRMPSSA